MNANQDPRLPALRRFAFAITLLNVAGHTLLGFEQSWATPLVAIAVAYGMELLLETLEAWRLGRRPRFIGPGTAFIDFLLSPHITALAVSMLLYSGERLLPIAFGTGGGVTPVAFAIKSRNTKYFAVGRPLSSSTES